MSKDNQQDKNWIEVFKKLDEFYSSVTDNEEIDQWMHGLSCDRLVEVVIYHKQKAWENYHKRRELCKEAHGIIPPGDEFWNDIPLSDEEEKFYYEYMDLYYKRSAHIAKH